MALNIKNTRVERLAAEVAELAQESKTEAIRRALEERRQRLLLRRASAPKYDLLFRLLKDRIWPEIPPHIRRTRLTKEEKERILGYGPEGF